MKSDDRDRIRSPNFVETAEDSMELTKIASEIFDDSMPEKPTLSPQVTSLVPLNSK